MPPRENAAFTAIRRLQSLARDRRLPNGDPVVQRELVCMLQEHNHAFAMILSFAESGETRLTLEALAEQELRFRGDFIRVSRGIEKTAHRPKPRRPKPALAAPAIEAKPADPPRARAFFPQGSQDASKPQAEA